MKQLYPFLLLLICLGFSACSDNDIRFESEFDRSYEKWQKFKEDNNNSYVFVIRNESWVGASWETTLTVSKGNIIRRSFNFISTLGLENIPQEAQSWTEEADEINSHTYSGAATTQTLDQIYETAKNEWLLKRDNAKTYFEAKNDGLISSCGYVENGCMDDCFTGIRISSITTPIEKQ